MRPVPCWDRAARSLSLQSWLALGVGGVGGRWLDNPPTGAVLLMPVAIQAELMLHAVADVPECIGSIALSRRHAACHRCSPLVPCSFEVLGLCRLLRECAAKHHG